MGGKIGFPTANIECADALPARGVYIAEVSGEGLSGKLSALCNLGIRPTFGGTSPRIEVHILGFSGDLYGKKLQVRLLRRLRAEKKFNSLDELKARIAEDMKALLQERPVPRRHS